MKTTITISIEEQIKKDFQEFAKDMWTNVTNLLSMFMKDSTRRRELKFSGNHFNIEFENFSKENLDDLMNDKQIIENTSKMEKLLCNV